MYVRTFVFCGTIVSSIAYGLMGPKGAHILLFNTFNPLVTNGLSHRYHFGGSGESGVVLNFLFTFSKNFL